METAAVTPSIPGLPPGAIVKPIAGAAAPSGLPPGAIVKPIAAPQPAASPAPPQNQNDSNSGQPGILQQIDQAGDTVNAFGSSLVHGAGKDAVGLVEELSSLIGRNVPRPPHQTGLTDLITGKQDGSQLTPAGDAADDAVTPKIRALVAKYLPSLQGDPQGFAEHVGASASQLLQFAYGEGEARKMMEGMSFADKLAESGKIAKVLEKYPNLAKYVTVAAKAGDTAVASGAAGTGVAAAHGASPTEALEQGAVAGGTAGLTEGLLGGVGAARGNVARYETAPKVLAEKTAAAETAGEAKTAAMRLERQAQAQGTIKNVAQDATRGSIGRINEMRTPTTLDTSIPAREGADSIPEGIAARNARQQLGSAASTVPGLAKNPIVEELGSQAATIPSSTFDAISGPGKTVGPNFEPINVDAAAAGVGSFKDAADQVEAAATPVYDKIDKATGGEFWKLKNQIRKGYATGDRDAVTAGTQGLDKLLSQPLPGVDGTDYRAAKTAFHDGKILDRLHSVVEGAFNGISEEDAAATGIPRELKGGQVQGALQTRLGKFLDNPPRGMDRAALERVIGPDGVKNLYTASHLTSAPELAAKTKEIAEETAKEVQRLTEENAAQFPEPMFARGGEFKGLSTHSTAFGTGMATARFVLRQMVMNPAVGDMMKYAVDYGANPQRAAKTIAALITAGMQGQKGSGQNPENPEDNGSSGEGQK